MSTVMPSPDSAFIDGIVAFAKKAIQTRIEEEAQKIVAEVITEVMSKINVRSERDLTSMKINVCFLYKEGE